MVLVLFIWQSDCCLFVESGIGFVGFLIQCISIDGVDSEGLKGGNRDEAAVAE